MRSIGKQALSYVLSLALLVSLLAVCGTILPTSAATVLFSENFNSTANGSLPSGWIVSSPSGVTDVSVQDGGLVIKAAKTSDAQTGVVYMGNELKNYGNYTFEADYTVLDADYLPISTSTRYSSMMFRIAGTTPINGYYAPYYYCTIRTKPSVQDELSIQKKLDNGSTTYYQIAKNAQLQTLELNQTYHLKVICRGANINYYIDDCHVFNQTLDTSGSTYQYITAGTIGFNTSNMTVRFDNVVVTEETGVVTTQPSYYDTYVPSTGLIDAPSVVADVSSSSVYNSISGTKLPSTALYYLSSSLNVTTPSGTAITSLSNALNKTNGKVIPALYIKDTATADALNTFVSNSGLSDAYIVSDSKSVLKYARDKMPNLYGVLYYKLTGAPSASTLSAMRNDTNCAWAKTVMIDSQYLTKEITAYFQKRLLNVWSIGTFDSAGIYNEIYKGVNGIVSASPSSVISVIESFTDTTLIREPFMVGHRGYPSKYPENTMASYRGAAEAGADLIETDVHLSKDGVAMLLHDDVLYNLTNCTDKSKSIENSTYAELRTYYVKNPNGTVSSERIPTLQEFLEYIKTTDVIAVIEIKYYNAELVTETCRVINALDMQDQVVFITFYGDQAIRCRNQMPGVSTGMLYNNGGSNTTGAGLAQWMKNNGLLRYNMTCHPNNSAVVRTDSSLNETNAGDWQFRTAAMKFCSERGLHFYLWTYTDQVLFDRGYIAGVQSFTGNYQEFDDTYVRKLTATSDTIVMPANTATAIKAEGEISGNNKSLVNCTVQRIGGDNITFTTSGTNVRASTTGTAIAILRYKVTTKNAGSYYVITAPVTIQVTTGSAQYEEHYISLLPSAAGFWKNAMKNMNIDATKNADGSYTLRNTTGNWPAVDNTELTSQQASIDDRLHYDITVGGALSIVVSFSDGSDAQIQKYFNGTNTYSGDDLVGNGKRFTGTISLADFVPTSAISNGSVSITGLRVFNIGDAGTDVIVHSIDLVQDVLSSGVMAGDVDGDKTVSSSDARLIIRHILGQANFTTTQLKAADYDGDGSVSSTDVRKMLRTVISA
ncbi:MAG: DUF1080 domain-containing protein [Clostridia bacterium]|nr:DUF1080 domain-containing protein [Clostridia bacterium]